MKYKFTGNEKWELYKETSGAFYYRNPADGMVITVPKD